VIDQGAGSGGSAAEPPRLAAPTRLQWWLIAAIVGCYGVGYPLALVGRSGLGWVLVGIGGLPLMALAVVTVLRITGRGAATR
jgi:hypothetical protein